MKSRHLARSLAVQTLYALDFNSELSEEMYPFKGLFPGRSDEEMNELETHIVIYAYYLINGVLQNLTEIDKVISVYSSRKIERISIVDRNILRISVFSFYYEKNIDFAIIIDEAVKLSQQLSNEINFKFINGVLDSVRKDLNDSVEK